MEEMSNMLLAQEEAGRNSVNPAEDVLLRTQAVEFAYKHLEDTHTGVMTCEQLQEKYPGIDVSKFAGLGPGAVANVIRVPVGLLDIPELVQKPIGMFLHPTLMDAEDYEEYWIYVDGKVEISFAAATLEVLAELMNLTEMVISNYTVFYFTKCKHFNIRRAVDGILLNLYAVFKTGDKFYPQILVPGSDETQIKLLSLGLKTLMVCASIMQNALDKPVSDTLAIALNLLSKGMTLADFSRLELVIQKMIEFVLPNPVSIRFRSNQFTFLLQEMVRIGWAFIRLSRQDIIRNAKHKIDFRPKYSQSIDLNFFTHYTQYLLTHAKTVKHLSLSDLCGILDQTAPRDFIEIFDKELPDCPYFSQYALHSTSVFKDQTLHLNIKTLVDKLMEKRIKSLQDLIDVKTEATLRLAAKKAVRNHQTRRSGRGRAANWKSQSQNRPKTVQKDSQDLLIVDQLTSMHVIDPGEVEYATLLVGEFVTKQVIYPVISKLGLNAETWSWEEMKSVLELEFNGRLANGKYFLAKCIEWVRMRNAVAHPVVERSSALWHDLEICKLELGDTATSELKMLLEISNVPKPKGNRPAFDPFIKPNIGLTAEKMELTISVLRLAQFALDKTINPACASNHIVPTLPMMRTWTVSLPFLSTSQNLSEKIMDALVMLVQIRNKYAHPEVTPALLQAVVGCGLTDSPDYEIFLRNLHKRI